MAKSCCEVGFFEEYMNRTDLRARLITRELGVVQFPRHPKHGNFTGIRDRGPVQQ